MAMAAADPAPAEVMTWARGSARLPAAQTPGTLVRPVASTTGKPAPSSPQPRPARRPSSWGVFPGRMNTAVRPITWPSASPLRHTNALPWRLPPICSGRSNLYSTTLAAMSGKLRMVPILAVACRRRRLPPPGDVAEPGQVRAIGHVAGRHQRRPARPAHQLLRSGCPSGRSRGGRRRPWPAPIAGGASGSGPRWAVR